MWSVTGAGIGEVAPVETGVAVAILPVPIGGNATPVLSVVEVAGWGELVGPTGAAVGAVALSADVLRYVCVAYVRILTVAAMAPSSHTNLLLRPKAGFVGGGKTVGMSVP